MLSISYLKVVNVLQRHAMLVLGNLLLIGGDFELVLMGAHAKVEFLSGCEGIRMSLLFSPFGAL